MRKYPRSTEQCVGKPYAFQGLCDGLVGSAAERIGVEAYAGPGRKVRILWERNEAGAKDIVLESGDVDAVDDDIASSPASID